MGSRSHSAKLCDTLVKADRYQQREITKKKRYAAKHQKKIKEEKKNSARVGKAVYLYDGQSNSPL